MYRFVRWAVVALATLAAGCATLPPPEGRTATSTIADTAETRLGRAVAPAVAANPARTGVHPLAEPRDAFAARVLLAAPPKSRWTSSTTSGTGTRSAI